MRAIARQLGGEYMDNPLWWAKRVITVHPLGGAPMGANPEVGVCDTYGEVYGYPGLHVLDGSMMPGPVGANPSLTIAALADRAATRILENGASPGQATASFATTSAAGAAEGTQAGAATPAAPGTTEEKVVEEKSGLKFTEQMKGFAALDVEDFQQGFDQGKDNDQRLMFELTISVDDVDKFVEDPAHEGSAEGYVEADLLGGRFEVEKGWFNLFTAGGDSDTREMRYRLWLTGPAGNPMTFVGTKIVRDAGGLDVWRDTSTLYVHIREGHLPPGSDTGRVLAGGIITIHIPDFMKQMTTFRTWGARPAHALEAFSRLFLGELYDVYGKLANREE